METTNHYIIAEMGVALSFSDGQVNGRHLIPSYEPFRVTEETYNECGIKLLHMHVDDTLKPWKKDICHRVKDVDTGNGITIVDRTDEGDYQFIIKDIAGKSCCLMQSGNGFSDCRCALNGSETMRSFGLNNAIMMVFAFAGCKQQTALVHASLIRKDGWGYAFTAKSGTGKSTQTSMWMRHIRGCDMMNDDNPVIRIIDGTPYIYGSPWSGKTPCYRNVKAKLGAVVTIKRDTTNHVEKVSTLEAFSSLITSCSIMKWDSGVMDDMCRIITKIIETTPNYNLFCRPNKESAIICEKTISRNEN